MVIGATCTCAATNCTMVYTMWWCYTRRIKCNDFNVLKCHQIYLNNIASAKGGICGRPQFKPDKFCNTIGHMLLEFIYCFNILSSYGFGYQAEVIEMFYMLSEFVGYIWIASSGLLIKVEFAQLVSAHKCKVFRPDEVIIIREKLIALHQSTNLSNANCCVFKRKYASFNHVIGGKIM